MVTTLETVDAHYPAIATSVPQARRAVAEFAERAGLSDERLQGLRLAVSEAVTNVVLHAYRGREGEVQIDAALAADELWALVADTGCGYQTTSKNPGSGFGLALIADACDEFVITERAHGGTEARMLFRLQQATPAPC